MVKERQANCSNLSLRKPETCTLDSQERVFVVSKDSRAEILLASG